MRSTSSGGIMLMVSTRSRKASWQEEEGGHSFVGGSGGDEQGTGAPLLGGTGKGRPGRSEGDDGPPLRRSSSPKPRTRPPRGLPAGSCRGTSRLLRHPLHHRGSNRRRR